MDARDRFFEVRDALGLTDYRIYTDVKGATKSMLDRLRQGVTTEISNKWFIPFLEAYPEVNANYILTGKGSKFNNEKPSTEDTCVECENLRLEIKNLKSKYNTLEIKYQSLLNAPKEDSEKKLLTVETSFYKETAEKLFWEVLSLKEKIEELEGGSNQKTAEV
jgi:predicted adenine nucleotide alpha hydrolase (AANH) superfamily ATPase